jgi:hypothetical protein
MANTNRPQGAQPINSPQGSVQTTAYRIENGYGTNLFVGDFVTLSGGYAIKATAGTNNKLLGAIVGFECDAGIDVAGYYPKDSTDNYKALVADAVDQRFIMQDDGDGTAMDLLDIGKTGNIITTHSGDTTTNISGMEADGSSFSGTGQAVTDQLRLVDIVDRPDNVAGANAEWIFTIHNHYYRQENNVDAIE